jgi:hypothetical protein
MMHNFFRKQLPTKVLFHNVAVLSLRPTPAVLYNINPAIAAFVDPSLTSFLHSMMAYPFEQHSLS